MGILGFFLSPLTNFCDRFLWRIVVTNYLMPRFNCLRKKSIYHGKITCPCPFKKVQKFAMCKRLQISTGSIHSRLIQSIFFASTCPILFLHLMAFQSQIERQRQNTDPKWENIHKIRLYKLKIYLRSKMNSFVRVAWTV